jgi:hypothetical protein
MARSLESQFPGTPAPPNNMAYGHQVPSISFSNQPPGAYPGPQQGGPPNMQGGYQGQTYTQGKHYNPHFELGVSNY